jgi:hypothetical protein
MIRRLTFAVLVACLALGVGGCVPWWKRGPSPAESAASSPPRWCYRTLGGIDCYAEAQPGMAERLVNVDPPGHFPQTPEAYAKEAAKPENQDLPENLASGGGAH